ncbi:hypothetical protein P4O66_013167 [Electrophorus voltai]|uniref:Uncharacterized protein n=1 Tax=Electrophorus voltai TaxID=2609070 RepID=A0AAD9DTW5_9TELE|nr:hypothetical protein P4O66_013167 [Electrophorus voltai]
MHTLLSVWQCWDSKPYQGAGLHSMSSVLCSHSDYTDLWPACHRPLLAKVMQMHSTGTNYWYITISEREWEACHSALLSTQDSLFPRSQNSMLVSSEVHLLAIGSSRVSLCAAPLSLRTLGRVPPDKRRSQLLQSAS